MLNLTLDWGDFQFVSDQTSMSRDINPEGTRIDLKIFASRKVQVILAHENGDMFHWAEGETLELSRLVRGFNSVKIACTKSTDYAVRLLMDLEVRSETNSGEPYVMQPDETELRFQRQVQHAIIKDLVAHGADQELIEDLLTGLNSDEDLEFEDDDLELPTEAEMNEMIEEARQRAAEEAAEETDDIDDDASEIVEDDPPPSEQENG